MHVLLEDAGRASKYSIKTPTRARSYLFIDLLDFGGNYFQREQETHIDKVQIILLPLKRAVNTKHSLNGLTLSCGSI